MQTLNHLPTLLQYLFVSEANQLARETGLIQPTSHTFFPTSVGARLAAESLRTDYQSQPLDLPFKHIVLRDSTQVSLPLSLAVAWPGGGNQNQKRAGMKIQASYEWVQGRVAAGLFTCDYQ